MRDDVVYVISEDTPTCGTCRPSYREPEPGWAETPTHVVVSLQQWRDIATRIATLEAADSEREERE